MAIYLEKTLAKVFGPSTRMLDLGITGNLVNATE